MNNTENKKAFTLIELLTVIAIIGILAAILIPAVKGVATNANIAASKATLSQYVNAVQSFKGEYSYLPFGDQLVDERLELSNKAKSKLFIETLSARDTSTYTTVAEGGNRRRIQFYEFSENEFYIGASDDAERDQLADRFNNTNIVIMIDSNGDGELEVPDPENPNSKIKIRATITAYVEADTDLDAPAYFLYE